MAATYQGKFHWVNHNANSLEPKPHQHEVLCHIRRDYHTWRKRKAAEQLRTSARVPRAQYNNASEWHRRESPHRTQETQRAAAFIAKPAIVINESPEDPSLQLVPWCGNSDPFSCFPVQVVPRVNQLIAFERDVLHPAAHSPWPLPSSGWDYCNYCWSWLLPHLDSSVSACYGYLSTIASILSRCCKQSNFLHMSLVYKQKAIELLQSQVAESAVKKKSGSPSSGDRWYQRPGQPDLLAVFALLFCEMFNENYGAAVAHFTILKALMDQATPVESTTALYHTTARAPPTAQIPPSLGSTPPSMLHNIYVRILDQDVQRAACTLTPTILPLSSSWWISIGLSEAVQPTLLPPQPHPPDAHNIPPNTSLYTLFSDIRELSLHLTYPLSRRCPASLHPLPTADAGFLPVSPLRSLPFQADFFYVWNYASILTGRFINHALFAHGQHQWRDAYACFAMAYFIRRSGQERKDIVPGSGIRLYSAAKGLLAMMREALEKEEEEKLQRWNQPSGKVCDERLELRLWALYVGCLSGEEEWFMLELKKLALRMRVANWEQAEKIFEGFSVLNHSRKAWERATGIGC